MRWLQTEYLLKGVFLGLVLYTSLELAQISPVDRAWWALLYANLATLGGLALGLILAGLVKWREGYRIKGRLFVFVVFLLLESPTFVYAGILGGTALTVFLLPEPKLQDLLYYIVGGGAAVGLAFGLVREIKKALPRALIILGMAALLVIAALQWFGELQLNLAGSGLPADQRLREGFAVSPVIFCVQLLLGIPFFYLLAFSGQEEESEVEIGAMCAALGLGLWILARVVIDRASSLAFLIPVALFFFYTTRVLPNLRVLKHAFRGLSYSRAGRFRRALQAFRRALELDPNHRLARDGFWEVHKSLDFEQLAGDPQTLALVDLDLCLDRAGSLLVQGKPSDAQMDEALRLLDLVQRMQPNRQPAIDYWRCVAHTHAGRFDEAGAELERILDPAIYGRDNPFRRAILLPAWQLALTLHEELRRRVGVPQLAQPGRRMEAIAAVERHLAEAPEDTGVGNIKRMLYHDLSEEDYDAYTGEGLVANHFDHQYVQQLGLGLITDSTRWQRGGEYLRLAARGLPTMGPTLFVQIAQANQRAGNEEGARHNYELAKRAGMSVGAKNLPEGERQTYFSTVKLLAEDAHARGDLAAAIENYHLYTESERSGLETLRTLAQLYEERGDALGALRITDRALCYNEKDPDLLARKDRYAFSVEPDQLRAASEAVRNSFDVDYCINKTKKILDGRAYSDFEWLEVAHHLIQLAMVVASERFLVKVLLARVLLRLGERDQALARLEEVRAARPERFASNEDEEAWYLACQILADLYLELGQGEQAVACLQDFRKSSRSGARTYLKLGQAYEQLGQRDKAIRCYQQVTAYDGNPLAPEAYDALSRLESGE
jgi:tetratricopeptide (TPR) repeat protein